MSFRQERIILNTKAGISNIDLTRQVQNIVKDSKIENGLCNILCRHTTAGLILNERDLMLVKDFERYIMNEIPDDKLYQHPSNGFSHLRSLFSRPEITIPIANSELMLGQWQNIMLWEFDKEGREREVVVTLIGD